jgi:predicted transcriptional regulator
METYTTISYGGKLVDKDIIIAMLKSKVYSHEEIAGIAQVSRSRISQIAGEAGLATPQNQVTLHEHMWVKLLSERTSHTVTELANKYGVSRAAIYQRENKHVS